MIFIVIIFSILFCLLAWRNLELAISLLIFLLPSYLIRFQIGPLPSTLLELMIWLVFLVWFFKHSGLTQYFKGKDKIGRFLTDRKKKSAYPFGPEIIVLLIVSFIAVGVTGFTNAALGAWKAYFFEPLLLYIVVLNVFSTDLKLPKIFWPLCLSALAVSLLAVYQKFTGNLIDNPFWAAGGTRRAVSFFGYPNAIGLYLGPLILLFIGWFSYAKFVCRAPKIFQLLIATATVLSLMAIVFARSAGALLGVGAGLVVFCLLAGKRARITVIALIVFAAIGCAAVPLARHSVVDKLMLRDFSGTVRRIGWSDTWKMLSDGRLVFGAGLANFQQTVRPYHQRGFFVSDGNADFWERLKTDPALRARTWQPLEIYLYPHNIFLNFWSELGLVGMLLFVWIIGKMMFVSFQNSDNANNLRFLSLGLLSAMVVILIHGLVDVPYFKNDLAVMFWLLIASISMINNFQINNISYENCNRP